VLDEASAAGTLDAKLAELQNAVDEKFPLAAPKFSSLEWLAKSLKSTKEGYAERRAVMILVKETKKRKREAEYATEADEKEDSRQYRIPTT
jgi:hypothetical protein